jgi:ubiquinone/menaquinone biosynthesis C-methylase UbiE
MARRTAQTHAGFFLPYLKSGMTLLDCGCGPGTTTVSLAQILSPSQVIGIDIGESQIELATAHATEKEVSNARFEVGSIYDLPFPDNTFDAAFAHTVLQHISDPVTALKEMRRVLKPGGVVGIREEDHGAHVIYPDNPLIAEAFDLYRKYWKQNGGDPYLPRRYKEILREAGFMRIEVTASAPIQATMEDTINFAEFLASHLLEPVFIDTVTEWMWIDRDKVQKMSEALKAWGEHPDAISIWVCCEGVGWKE